MNNKRVNIDGLYKWILSEIDEAERNNSIQPNIEDWRPFPSEFFLNNNDKIFANGTLMAIVVDESQKTGVVFNVDVEWSDIGGFELQKRYDINAISKPLFDTLEILFNREYLLENYKDNIIKYGYEIALLNSESFSESEESLLMKKKYTYQEFYVDLSKTITNTLKEIKNNFKSDDIFSSKSKEVSSLFYYPEGTLYPERYDFEISEYLTFQKDLDKFEKNEVLVVDGTRYIVDKLSFNYSDPEVGLETEHGYIIDQKSSYNQLMLFKESDNSLWAFDFYKTEQKIKGKTVFFCCSIYETQNYEYDITRWIPEDGRELTQATTSVPSNKAYHPDDFEYLRNTKISEGQSMAEQTQNAFKKEFYKKTEKLSEDFDVRKWSDNFILKHFDLDLRENTVEEVKKPTAKRKKMKF